MRGDKMMASFCVLPYILCVYVVFHLIFSTTLCTLGVYMDIRELISLNVKTKINVVLLFCSTRCVLSLSLFLWECLLEWWKQIAANGTIGPWIVRNQLRACNFAWIHSDSRLTGLEGLFAAPGGGAAIFYRLHLSHVCRKLLQYTIYANRVRFSRL